MAAEAAEQLPEAEAAAPPAAAEAVQHLRVLPEAVSVTAAEVMAATIPAQQAAEAAEQAIPEAEAEAEAVIKADPPEAAEAAVQATSMAD